MKKVLLFCAAAAALVLSASCNKGGDTKGVVLPAPKYAARPKSFCWMSSASPIPVSTPSSSPRAAVILFAVGVSGPSAVKGERSVEFFHGTYTVSNIYTLSGFAGTITVNGNQVTIQRPAARPLFYFTTEADKYPGQ